MYMNKSLVITIVVLLILGLGIAWVWGSVNNTPTLDPGEEQNEVACTLEAKICPDGSTVGRVGPSCEFEACPSGTVESTSQWQTATNTEAEVSFRYPETLPTFYIEAVDWPPQVQVLPEMFVCEEAGEVTDRAGKTESRTIDGTSFCVTTITEGAAGSVYDQYAYAYESGGQETTILTFSTRSSQCGNYDSDQENACELERTAFNLDELIGQIVETIERQ